MGMSTQLALFGVCIAAGHPLYFVAASLAMLAAVVALFLRRESLIKVDRGVVLEHR